MNLRPLHRKILIKKIKKLGFDGPYIGGNHEYLINKNGFKIFIPNIHSGKDIPIPLLKAIIRQLNTTVDIFFDL